VQPGVDDGGHVHVVVVVAFDPHVGAALGLLAQHAVDDGANQVDHALVQILLHQRQPADFIELAAVVVGLAQPGAQAPRGLLHAVGQQPLERVQAEGAGGCEVAVALRIAWPIVVRLHRAHRHRRQFG
jgi:hypothetical protein